MDHAHARIDHWCVFLIDLYPTSITRVPTRLYTYRNQSFESVIVELPAVQSTHTLRSQSRNPCNQNRNLRNQSCSLHNQSCNLRSQSSLYNLRSL